jgi:maltooligosyltrehalose trehalohydrolase
MQPDTHGYFVAELSNIAPGTRYFYLLDENEQDLPDPASHFQPEGVHGPSAVVDHRAYAWKNQAWKNIPVRDLILYELHVGTFTPEGTFTAMIPRLNDLAETGINAIELMPISQFPGNRNWGYDGVLPYAVQNTYGTPEEFKQLIDECHARGIAVFLDLVYNHLGPEGNYFGQYGPYFTDRYCTPWGEAINFDGEYCDAVRDYFSDNTLHWFEHYRIDGLRLDAIHAVLDNSAIHFWEYTTDKLHHLSREKGRPMYLIAESDLNSPKVVRPTEVGGYGFDAQWLDDFHHILYVLVDPAGRERYADFNGLEHLAKALQEGFVHSGEYVEFRKKKYGASSAGVPGDRFVVFTQNHDQVGNRVEGERLSVLVSFDAQKLAAAVMLLSPYIPMLFMGEEYAEDAPFLYFISHTDPELIEAVRKGRKEEFANYNGDAEPPDPQDEQTFNKVKLQWQKRNEGKHRVMHQWYRELIQLRKQHPALSCPEKNCLRAVPVHDQVLMMQRWDAQEYLMCFFNFSDQPVRITQPDSTRTWRKLLDSSATQWRENAADHTTDSSLPERLESTTQLLLPPWAVLVYEGQ